MRYYLENVTLKGAWSGPAAIELFEHAMCGVARLAVRGVVSASHFVTDLTLGLGEVVHDYLKYEITSPIRRRGSPNVISS